MADEFQTGVCGGNLWNSWKSTLGSSPCSTGINDMGSFGWPSHDLVAIKGRSSSSDESIAFQDLQKPQQCDSIDGGSTVLIDSTLQMMGIGLSSSTAMDWNQTLLSGTGRGESNNIYDHPLLQEDMNSRLKYKERRLIDYGHQGQDSTLSSGFKASMNQGFSLNEAGLNCVTTSSSSCTGKGTGTGTGTGTNDCTVPITCQGLSTSFSMSSTSYDYPSALLHTLFDTTTSDHPQPQASIFDKPALLSNIPSTTNYGTSFNDDFSPTMPKFSSLLKPSLPRLQPTSHLHFNNNNTPFWNASTAPINDIRPSFFPNSMQSQFLLASTLFEEKPSCTNLTAKPNNVEVGDSSSVTKKNSIEPVFKRPRIETPSPLPTFKVRKEKLGDRITALQQLVSPFGKTDTASVLHEAIEYIKILHGQVSLLSTPYLKNGAPIRHQQTSNKMKEQEGPKQDLKSRGLCLVPISSTFPVANETTGDFWTPTFGGIFH